MRSRPPMISSSNLAMMNKAAATMEAAEREKIEKERAEQMEAFRKDVESRCINVAIPGLNPLAVYADTIVFGIKGFVGHSPITHGRTAFSFENVAALTIEDDEASPVAKEIFKDLVTAWLSFSCPEPYKTPAPAEAAE
jgi:hypothetical protein